MTTLHTTCNALQTKRNLPKSFLKSRNSGHGAAVSRSYDSRSAEHRFQSMLELSAWYEALKADIKDGMDQEEEKLQKDNSGKRC